MFALDSVHRHITPLELWDVLAQHAILPSDVARDRNLIARVRQCQEDYLESQAFGIGNLVLPRVEADRAVAILLDPAESTRSVFLVGPAGMGKTGAAGQIVQRVAVAGWLVLPFRLDRLDPTQRLRDLREQEKTHATSISVGPLEPERVKEVVEHLSLPQDRLGPSQIELLRLPLHLALLAGVSQEQDEQILGVLTWSEAAAKSERIEALFHRLVTGPGRNWAFSCRAYKGFIKTYCYRRTRGVGVASRALGHWLRLLAEVDGAIRRPDLGSGLSRAEPLGAGGLARW